MLTENTGNKPIAYWCIGILILFTNCNLDFDRPKEFNSESLVQNNHKDEVSGDWELCQIVHGNTTINGNICPHIFFFQNGTGSDYREKDSIFQWSVHDDKIMLRYTNYLAHHTFNDSIYYIDIKRDSLFLKMVLYSLDSNHKFVLYKDG